MHCGGSPHHGARDTTSTRHGTSKKMLSSTALSLWPIPHGIARNRRNNYFAVEQQPQPPRRGTTGGGRSSSSTARGYYGRHIVERLAQRIVSSPRYSAKAASSPAEVRCARDRRRVSFVTLLRVVVPSLVAGVLAYLVFPALALALASSFRDPGVFTVLSQDSSQFVQNFLTVAGLLFSILVGQTCES